MIGYGPEDDHFVAELTYNYGIKSYKLGNAFQVSFLWTNESKDGLIQILNFFLFLLSQFMYLTFIWRERKSGSFNIVLLLFSIILFAL